MIEIEPKQVYTTKEAEDYLKISTSTMKRWIKKGILKAHKVGGTYRILGLEILHLVSPKIEKKAMIAYREAKNKTIKQINKW